MDTHDLLTIGEVAQRSGFATSALRYYEQAGLIHSTRTSGQQRRYERSTLRRLAFIVDRIMSAQRMPIERAERRIVSDRKEARQDRLVQQLGEGLAFFVAALPLAFQPVAQHLMEKYCRGAPAQDRRPG